jgi:transcriptional regulator with XRE-family HTH domain
MGGRSKGEGTGFGAILKAIRERVGLSQQGLADKAGMNVFGVAKLEQGHREPAWATVLQLADALGVEVTEFIPPKEASAPEELARPAGKRK